MGHDDPQSEQKIRLGHQPVDEKLRSGGKRSQKTRESGSSATWGSDSEAPDQLLPVNLEILLRRVGIVDARGHHQGHFFVRNARLGETPQHRRQQQRVGVGRVMSFTTTTTLSGFLA